MQLIQLDAHLSAIDHDLLATPRVGATYVLRGDEVALVETGTSLTVSATLAGLERLGVRREEVAHILCTHVHMDHAGGAGYLARALPRATVYIHSSTAQFLVQPERLMASVRRAVGEEMWPLHGDVLPLDPARLRPAESLRLDLGRGVTIEGLPTPGHSPDHVAFREGRGGGLFVGDAAGVAMREWGLVRPVTPPPAYNYAAQLDTLAALRARAGDFSRLFFTHFGPSDDVAGTLAALDEGLRALAEGVRAAFEAGDEDIDAITARLLPVDRSQESGPVAYAWARMSVAGLLRYFKKEAEKQARVVE
jgi:glyoxylase-like metal-dependent hydrolase (beta-lactamase superfamily II)